MNSLSRLPIELLHKSMDYLPFQDISSLSGTSKNIQRCQLSFFGARLIVSLPDEVPQNRLLDLFSWRFPEEERCMILGVWTESQRGKFITGRSPQVESNTFYSQVTELIKPGYLRNKILQVGDLYLKYIRSQYELLSEKLILHHCTSPSHGSVNDRCFLAMRILGEAPLVWSQNRHVLLHLFRQCNDADDHGFSVLNFCTKFRGDREFLLKAIQKSGSIDQLSIVFSYASPELKNNQAFILDAVRGSQYQGQRNCIISMVSQEMRDDPAVRALLVVQEARIEEPKVEPPKVSRSCKGYGPLK